MCLIPVAILVLIPPPRRIPGSRGQQARGKDLLARRVAAFSIPPPRTPTSLSVFTDSTSTPHPKSQPKVFVRHPVALSTPLLTTHLVQNHYNDNDTLKAVREMAQPTQVYPPWLAPSAVVITDAAGAPVTTSTTILYLPPTYFGPNTTWFVIHLRWLVGACHHRPPFTNTTNGDANPWCDYHNSNHDYRDTHDLCDTHFLTSDHSYLLNFRFIYDLIICITNITNDHHFTFTYNFTHFFRNPFSYQWPNGINWPFQRSTRRGHRSQHPRSHLSLRPCPLLLPLVQRTTQ
ncbi:hypothetical protein NLJ89_g11317 [Agrocybe chaxingu]|uniref:Uncharacterized protein n=1 Tax=Agrocybe chaxingu TaxID=84603 RepID=A0A9W8JX04_9AGAR|nr:hypothetical protein NLJ89_g11317 [Agrocybe chaxingu]